MSVFGKEKYRQLSRNVHVFGAWLTPLCARRCGEPRQTLRETLFKLLKTSFYKPLTLFDNLSNFEAAYLCLRHHQDAHRKPKKEVSNGKVILHPSSPFHKRRPNPIEQMPKPPRDWQEHRLLETVHRLDTPPRHLFFFQRTPLLVWVFLPYGTLVDRTCAKVAFDCGREYERECDGGVFDGEGLVEDERGGLGGGVERARGGGYDSGEGG